MWRNRLTNLEKLKIGKYENMGNQLQNSFFERNFKQQKYFGETCFFIFINKIEENLVSYL